MIVVETSAWIEFFRATGSAADRTIARLIEEGEESIALTEVVVLELLVGVAPGRALERLRRRLLAFTVLPLEGLSGYEAAATLYHACRQAGETLRSLADCLIAVPALGAGAPVLHADRDFDVLARHTALEVFPLDD